MDDFTVCIGTYGDSGWEKLAEERAAPSAAPQAPVVHEHGDTLAEARNAALRQVTTEFAIHLDADDELEPGYVEAMERGSTDLRAPRIRQVKNGRPGRPFMPQVFAHNHACAARCLRQGNWIVIGAAVRVTKLLKAGGWREEGWSEDWSAWARVWAAGGTIETVPDAVYKAHVDPNSRNHCLPRGEMARWHQEIEQSIDWPA